MSATIKAQYAKYFIVRLCDTEGRVRYGYGVSPHLAWKEAYKTHRILMSVQ